jgi:aryl-alcohol dehydrogenase-like predicted oxidoreductase
VGRRSLICLNRRDADPNYEIEHCAKVLNEMVEEGNFDYIGLSEVRAEPYAARTRYEAFLFNPVLLPDPLHAHGFLLCELGYACRHGGD